MDIIIVEEIDAGTRLDVFLCEKRTDFSRSQAKKHIEQGLVLVNKKNEKAGYNLKLGDKISIEKVEMKELDATPQDIPIDIVFEDEWLAVINKQQGLVVHPASGSRDHTLVNALLFRIKDLSGINGVLRPGIVHRLDKDTSGLMVVAKNDYAHRDLAKQIQTKECRRVYWALCEGIFKQTQGTIQTNLAREKKDRKKYAVCGDNEGRHAITNYKVLEQYKDTALVEFELKTGRTHQIRVHSKYLGHPIVGDKFYGYKKQKFSLEGQLLHSKILIFTHPKSKHEMRFECDLPVYFIDVLNKVRKQSGIDEPLKK